MFECSEIPRPENDGISDYRFLVRTFRPFRCRGRYRFGSSFAVGYFIKQEVRECRATFSDRAGEGVGRSLSIGRWETWSRLPSISQPPSLPPSLTDKKWARYKLHLNELRGRGRSSSSLCRRRSSWIGIIKNNRPRPRPSAMPFRPF